MAELDLVDNSPRQPKPKVPIASASNLILIDNYDSFTWNVYQYLVLEGATVTVFRNDEIDLEQLIAKSPTQLVVSPGPGHPDTDSGISKAAIKHFAGKIPVLGVCMGEQCVYSVFGGEVAVTGEILHGKVSSLKHDSKGVYAGLPQDLDVTRYHSLAGTHLTLPSCLEVSSWVKAKDEGREVIMGIRHKEYVIEGVQFHPESILTEQGSRMLRNFLQMQGGTWAENDRLKANAAGAGHSMAINGANNSATSTAVTSAPKENILVKIFRHRKAAVDKLKDTPSHSHADLQAAYELNLSPSQISFPQRLRESPYQISLMAEIKRASPSKGIIAISACAPYQAQTYALAGASVISVLTEPEWFKGSIDDLRMVRQSLEGMPNRPAVLMKEFVFDEYQILQGRLAGADTILLIVKMLDDTTLKRLYLYSLSLGMEPLVEVNTAEEMKTAIALGSKVIGVNNRDLTNFEVDLETTSRLMESIPESTTVCALSGITGPKDVELYRKPGSGVGAVLVGEALMRATDTTQFVRELLDGGGPPNRTTHSPELLVKICGTRTPEVAKIAIEAGADLIGMILVEGRTRFVPEDTALAISKVVHETIKDRQSFPRKKRPSKTASDFFSYTTTTHLVTRHRALLVGVFRNQPLDHILQQQKLLDLDIVQLHGDEPVEWATLIPVPVIHSFKPGDIGVGKRGYHAVSLLDAGSGGSGQTLEQGELTLALTSQPGLQVFLAGGLNTGNVADKIKQLGDCENQIAGVDVSSGVEENGVQSPEKVKAFIAAAKLIRTNYD